MNTMVLLALLAQSFTTLKVQPDQVVLLTAPKPRPVSRILMHFVLDSVDTQRVVDARLVWTSPEGLPPDRRFLVQITPVIRPWDPATVSWTHPWVHPGGDYDATVSRYLALPPAGQEVQVDLTLFVRQPGRYPGILLKPPPFQGIGFGAASRLLYQALKKAVLYVRLSPGESDTDTLSRLSHGEAPSPGPRHRP